MTKSLSGMEKHLDYLRDTADTFATLKADYEHLLAIKKTMLYQISARMSEKSATAREQRAYSSPDFVAYLENTSKMAKEFYSLEEHRRNAQIMIECWKSVTAARAAHIELDE